jgi:hypothetical protein
MIVLIAAALGIALGIVNAKRRNGNRLDMLQYAAGYGIAFSLVGVFLTLLIDTYAG